MSTTAIILVSLSAGVHALWNLAGKRQNPSAAFFLIAATCAALITLPLCFVYRAVLGLIPLEVWALLLATGVCQAGYYVGLAGAYQRGDLSVAYPLVRALPVLLIALISLGLGKPFSLAGGLGILAVAGGCILIPLPEFRNFNLRTYLAGNTGLILLAALGTTGYTLIDNHALAILRSLPGSGLSSTGSTLLFLALENLVTALLLGGYVWLSTGQRLQLKASWGTAWPGAAATGVLITSAYGLVLLAMAFAANVSYIAAFRQFSIPLGATLGFLIQKEPAAPPRLVGIGILTLGLVLIAIAS
jgi:drug/metabolite transporter (DMT)-like permease